MSPSPFHAGLVALLPSYAGPEPVAITTVNVYDSHVASREQQFSSSKVCVALILISQSTSGFLSLGSPTRVIVPVTNQTRLCNQTLPRFFTKPKWSLDGAERAPKSFFLMDIHLLLIIKTSRGALPDAQSKISLWK